MRRLIFLIIVICLVILDSAVFAGQEGPVIRSSVNKKNIFIGDRVRYTVEVRANKELDCEFPKFKDDRIGDFEIKDLSRIDENRFFGERIYSTRYDITTYSAGKHLIPPCEVKYKEKNGKEWSSKKTEDITIKVASAIPPGAVVRDIKDIKGPSYFYSINIWLLAVFGILILSAIAISFMVYINSRKKASPLPPHEAAFIELGRAKAALADSGNVKNYYVGISDSIRHYIESVFTLKAPEMTTEEFLVSLRDSGTLSVPHKDLLKDFLKACDLVKFAKYMPDRSEIEIVFTTAHNFVEQTKDIMTKMKETK